MSREIDHHQPRKIDKRKRHSKGFSEGVDDKRAARVGFKRYLRELEEEVLLDDQDDDVNLDEELE